MPVAKILSNKAVRTGDCTIRVLLLQCATIYTRLPLIPQGATDTKPDDDYSKGVVFYLKEKKVVGVLTWNCYGKMDLAREVITHQFLMCVHFITKCLHTDDSR